MSLKVGDIVRYSENQLLYEIYKIDGTEVYVKRQGAPSGSASAFFFKLISSAKKLVTEVDFLDAFQINFKDGI